MPFLVLLGIAAAIAAGVALSGKSPPPQVSAAMTDMLNRYTVLGPDGVTRVFKPDVALGIVRTLGAQLYSYVDGKDPSRIQIRPDPTGAPPAADLSALGWARTQNASMTVMCPVYMAEASSADRFLVTVAPGQEASQPSVYCVLLFAGTLAKNLTPPGQPGLVAGGTAPVATTLSTASQEIPADLLGQYNQLLVSGTDPNQLLFVASELDAVGASTAAEALRKRAADLTAAAAQQGGGGGIPASMPSPTTSLGPSAAPSGTVPAGTPVLSSAAPGAPPQVDSHAADTPAVQTPSGVLTQTAQGPGVVVPTAQGGAAIVIPSPVQKAAIAMNLALSARGYKQADQPLYRGFQAAAGLGSDGFPGAGTMAKFAATLATIPGAAMAPVRVYPFLSRTPSGATGQAAFDGVNAPTWAEWTGGAPAMPSMTLPAGLPAGLPTTLAQAAQAAAQAAPQLAAQIAQAFTPSAAAVGVGPTGAPLIPLPTVMPTTPIGLASLAMAKVLNAHGYNVADSFVYKGFQMAAGLGSDGFPGAGTMGALGTSLKSIGSSLPSGFPIYPFRSKTPSGATGNAAFDGQNAPTYASWTRPVSALGAAVA